MPVTITPTMDQVLAAFRTVLLGWLDPSVEVVKGQVNRVPSPKAPNYVVMTPILAPRLATNLDEFFDCYFTASMAPIADTVTSTMTVTAIPAAGSPNFPGALKAGNTVWGQGVSANTVILSQSSGTPGGIGAYIVSNAQAVASENMAAGYETLTQPTEFHLQIDVHGPASMQNAITLSTLLRDDAGVQAFEALNLPYLISPLYADDPKQIPFANDQQQVEYRWVVDARAQVDFTATLPLQFATEIATGLINVDVVYPPN
jgi:hypothetical protein